tara:strand:+ start:94795 stop:95472 length:678 start_codon:yes stop_codon:yes gene_type:complete
MTRFSRWSQRKRGLEPTDGQTSERAFTPDKEGAVHDGAIHKDSVSDHESAEDSQATPSQEAIEELPDPATLPPGSDLTAYLAHGVSREVRRRALKRMFAADHYHHRDGLNDYDDDYRQLKNLSQEVADRLREWTRQPSDKVEDTQHEPEQAEHDISGPAETTEAKREDTPEAGDGSLSDDQAQAADEVTSESTPRHAEQGSQEEAHAKGHGTNEAKPPLPEKGRT